MATLSSALNPLTLGLPSGSSSRLNEKDKMQELNTRLSMYITHVREIRENAHKVDSSAFLDSIKILEDELIHLKDIYESELDKTRAEAEELKHVKNQLVMESNKMKSLASDLENRLQTETDRNQQAANEIIMLQRELLQKDQDVKNAQLAIKKPIAEVEQLQTLHDAVFRENQDIKRRYEKEQLERQECQDRAHEIQEKLEFQLRVHDEQMRDMNHRLQTSSATILELEAKIRDYAVADSSLQDVLQRVRETAEASLRQYQEESAVAFNQSLSELQSQLNTTNSKLREVTDENERLHEEAGNHMARCKQLEGQIAALTSQRDAAEDLVNHERIRARDNIESLERKLRSLQDLLVSKMREVNAARDAQIPLKAEIEAFRSMLEEEERRLRLPPTFHGESAPGAPFSAFNQTSISTTSAANNLNSTKAGMNSLFSTNALPMSPAASIGLSHQPLGPVRVRSAPNKERPVNLVPTTLGQGKDYFDGLFNDLKVRSDPSRVSSSPVKRTGTCGSHIQPLPSPPQSLPAVPPVRSNVPQVRSDPPPGAPFTDNKQKSPLATEKALSPPAGDQVSSPPAMVDTHDYNTATSSSTGSLRVLEVHPEGKYIRLLNSSQSDEELGGYLIQQNVGGHPVAAFRFPPRVNFPANNTVSVWCGTTDPLLHQPPTDFIFKEQQKWGTGPECTTILCRPNGQAVAWTTAAHRFSRDAYQETSSSPSTPGQGGQPGEAQYTMGDNLPEADCLPEYNMDTNAPKPEPVYLKREKESPPSLHPPKHPHGVQPPASVHPHTGQARPLTYGNDNSSVNRQSRGQSTRPDPIPGAPYAGASAQRMGSALLRKSNASGAIANRATGTIRFGNPSPFLSPLQQDFAQANDHRATCLQKL